MLYQSSQNAEQIVEWYGHTSKLKRPSQVKKFVLLSLLQIVIHICALGLIGLRRPFIALYRIIFGADQATRNYVSGLYIVVKTSNAVTPFEGVFDNQTIL